MDPVPSGRPGESTVPGAARGATRPRWRPGEALIYVGPAILGMAVVFALSSIPNPPPLPDGVSDKAAHFVEYAGLGVLLVRAFAWRGWTRPSLAVACGAVLMAVVYGMTDEGHQIFVPGRQADWHDVAADALGAGLAAGTLYGWGILAGFRWRQGSGRGRRRPPVARGRD
jgi:hypothetical protein